MFFTNINEFINTIPCEVGKYYHPSFINRETEAGQSDFPEVMYAVRNRAGK